MPLIFPGRVQPHDAGTPDRVAPGRPRLLVVASTFPASSDDGTPGFVRDLAAYESSEFDTLVLVPRVPGAPRRERLGRMTVERFRYFPRRFEDLADGAIIENLRSRRSRWLQVVPFLLAESWAVRRAVRRYQPDAVHLHWLLPQGVAAVLGARRVPWLLTTLGGDVYALRDPVSRWVKRLVIRRARLITTMNSDMKARLVALGAHPEDVRILPMGADLDSVRAAGDQLTREPGRLLFAGRLVEKKGASVLLDALHQLRDVDGWSLVVVGDGPLRGELERRAEGLPVLFRGALSRQELAMEYARSEVVVVPSVPAASGDQDGLPVALIEAMGAGCAVVASRLAGIDMAVVDGVSGQLVPAAEPAALAAALRAMLADPQLRQRLSIGARRRAEEFSVGVVGQQYCALLREVAGLQPTSAEPDQPTGAQLEAPAGVPADPSADGQACGSDVVDGAADRPAG